MSRRVGTAPPLLLLLLLAASATGQRNAASNPALHRLNERVISTAFNNGENEVVCTFCLLQVISAAYQVGNEVVQSEIEGALSTFDPSPLSDALLQEVAHLPTLSGMTTGYFQRGAFDNCPTRIKRDQCDFIETFRRSQRGRAVDFGNRGTVDTINGDVARATNGKIKKLFDFLPGNTQLVFASALAFSDQWLSTLQTRKARFSLDPQNRVNVTYLVNTDSMPVMQDSGDGVVGVSIPYKNLAVRLYCFMTKGKHASITELLNQEHYQRLFTANEELVQVKLPKFDIVSKMRRYEEFMQKFGMPEMFQGGLGPRDNLKVDQLVHKAVIQADEKGTSAAGAAGVSFVPLSAAPERFRLHFNKPFVCSLVLDEPLQQLFTVYVADPRKS